ncbi:hypothetical protein EG329_011579 [Mollisiaceae sp. DMI_Dod_QoI]|nr:hypothetical protein EG329_011579 [Helotiales sp. DMI_Dod_QoI]
MSYLTIDTSKTMSYYPYEEPDTWSIAKVAHDKLLSEASFPDHDLRKIVAHATLYDRLLDEYYSSSPPSSPPSSPSSPTKLAFESIPEEKSMALETKEEEEEEEAHRGTVIEQSTACGLMKVPSHSDNLAACTEVAVEEVEIFDDD